MAQLGDDLVVELRAVARLPLAAAQDAELRLAAARHVVAARAALDHDPAVAAAAPAFLLRDLGEGARGLVLGAVLAGVVLAVARRADLGLAARAFAVFAALAVEREGGRFDPFAAAAHGAVEAVFRRVFLVFFVPFGFELGVEELVDVLEGDVLGLAAFGRHVGRVRDGHGEEAYEAVVAHIVRAGESSGLEAGNRVVEAGDAGYAGEEGQRLDLVGDLEGREGGEEGG